MSGHAHHTRRILLGAIAACVTAGSALVADCNEHSFKLGHVIADDHPAALGGKRWAELLAQRSGGKIKVRVHGNGTLGGDTQTTSAVQEGVQKLGIITSSPMASVVKEIGLLDLPFTFNTAQEVDSVLAGPVGQAIAARMSDKGMVVLGWMENGFRSITNSKRPITRLEDLQGLKIWVLQNPLYIDALNTLGPTRCRCRFRRCTPRWNPGPWTARRTRWAPSTPPSSMRCRST